jgi:FkbH-like protein
MKTQDRSVRAKSEPPMDTRQWVDRYLVGDYRPRRVLRFFLQDFLVASWLRLKLGSRFAATGDGRLSQRSRARWRRMVAGYELRGVRYRHNHHLFRAPDELRISDHGIRRIVLVGTCLVHEWQYIFERQGTPCDFVLSNNLNEIPDGPPKAIAEYDLQVIQISLRSVLPDLSLARLSYDDLAGHQDLLDHSRQLLSQTLSQGMRWNTKHGLLTFVANFMVPQQDPSGRLMPRHDVRNPMYFVEQLNAHLSEELRLYQNAYLLDIDQIAATFGKKYVQDDSVLGLNHGSALNNYHFELDAGRIEPSLPLTEYYCVRRDEFILAIWAELVAMYRTLNRKDEVKLVVIDLDDTLWRGLAVEEGRVSTQATEGWPLGFMEALCFLKRRGVLLAIASKNDANKIANIWDQVTHGRIRLDDFAVRKINWAPKVQNVEEIISEINVLPRNVLFIDDNPVERASVKAAFPEIRVMDGRHFFWRRTLLWAAETQVAMVTSEAARRTQMVQAQIERDASRRRLSREEFLASLAIKARLFEIDSANHPSFSRVFELLNKTNQFNTTGKRWTRTECSSALSQGHVFFAFEVEDKFTFYGLVGVAIVTDRSIEQFVMSCRVLGLDVEIAAVAVIAQRIVDNEQGDIAGELTVTDANAPCRDLFKRCGFEEDHGRWMRREAATIAKPSHVTVSWVKDGHAKSS